MGLGVVGGGVASTLLHRNQSIPHKSGCPIKLKKVLVRDLARHRSSSVPTELLTTDPRDILDNPEVHLLIEVIGGEYPASRYIREALTRGKHVVTANKEVMAKQGPELISLAAAKKVNLLFEASVGGGIPIVGPLMKDLLANDIRSIHAIINGTTNYILTRMARDRVDFHEALREAQEQGFAEADPTNDIEGTDAAYKLAVLASLAFHTRVHSDDVYREGISRLQAQDFRYAQELGYTIKLLAIAREDGAAVQVRVHPVFVPQEHMLAKVDGVFNAVEVEGDLTGRVLFHGMGAGQNPTTSAVIGNVVEIAREISSGSEPIPVTELDKPHAIAPMTGLISRYYLRLTLADQAGVLAQIARILGDLNISIASVIQKDTNPEAQTAEVVVTTHPAREEAMQESLKRIEPLEAIREINNLVRVEDLPLN
jgi:homoserine dehydrogenase